MVPLVIYMGWLGLSNQTGLICLHVTLASSQAIFLLDELHPFGPAGSGRIRFYRRLHNMGRLLAGGPSAGQTYDRYGAGSQRSVGMERLPDAFAHSEHRSESWTLPLFQYNFKSQYTYDYNMAFASYLIAIVPVMIAYIFARSILLKA